MPRFSFSIMKMKFLSNAHKERKQRTLPWNTFNISLGKAEDTKLKYLDSKPPQATYSQNNVEDVQQHKNKYVAANAQTLSEANNGIDHHRNDGASDEDEGVCEGRTTSGKGYH